MDRRGFLRSSGLAAASLALPKAGRLLAEGTTSGGWRTFDVTTRVEVLKYSGTTRVLGAGSAHAADGFSENACQYFQLRGRRGEDGRKLCGRARNRRRRVSRQSKTGPHADQPNPNQGLCRKVLRSRESAPGGSRRARALLAADEAASHKRDRQSDGRRDH